MVIADRLLVAVNELIQNPAEYTGAYVLVAMFLYAIELYGDFTGGIDITIGIAQGCQPIFQLLTTAPTTMTGCAPPSAKL